MQGSLLEGDRRGTGIVERTPGVSCRERPARSSKVGTSGGEALSAFGAPRADDGASAPRGHTRAKAVSTGPLEATWLECTFHDCCSFVNAVLPSEPRCGFRRVPAPSPCLRPGFLSPDRPLVLGRRQECPTKESNSIVLAVRGQDVARHGAWR